MTGGGNGLGKQIALRLAKEGCKLAIVDLNYEAAKAVAQEITEQYEVEAQAYKADVSDIESVKVLKKNVESEMGFVDILVNNAGVLPRMSLREGSEEDIRKIVEINLLSHLWVYH